MRGSSLDTGISEFTYAHGFLYEQTLAKWSSLCSAPILPSLTDENSKGWDAHLPTMGAAYYYQFKLSEYLRGPNSNCWRDNHFRGPHFRFWMHRRDRNKQHSLLRSLASDHPNTYYVVPEFTTRDVFNHAFLKGEVLRHSRLFALAECEEHHDDEPHYITFESGFRHWAEHSDPVWHEQSMFGTDLGGLYLSSESLWRPINKDFAVDLVLDLERTVERGLAVARSTDDDNQFPTLRDDLALGTPSAVQLLALPPHPSFDDASSEQLLVHASNLASSVFGVALVLAGRGT
jgi:hypothetical protein